MENCCSFFFYNNIHWQFLTNFLDNRARKRKEIPPWSVLLSTIALQSINQSINQSARDPVIRVELKFRVCFHVDITVDFIFDCIDALPG